MAGTVASSLSAADRDTLLRVAATSIAHGLRYGSPMTIFLLEFNPPLRESRATFTTLHLDGRLRGCIGSLVALRPLVDDVAHTAFGAAFQDPRFPPVTAAEFPRLNLHISILSPPEPITFFSEGDLLSQIRPGIDGVILEDINPHRRGTFLPAVWETLPDPQVFMEHLKLKAGLPKDYWSPTIRAWRYTTESLP